MCWCLIAFISVGLIGCAPSTATVVSQTPCLPESAGGNMYVATPNTSTSNIFQYAATSTPDPTTILSVQDISNLQDAKIRDARYAALKVLEHETERWTVVNEFILDATNKTQIMITFLSPELLQAVFQNNVLAHNPKNTDVNAAINSGLAQIADRKELIFLVTIIATNQNGGNPSTHILDLDMRQMILKNADDYDIVPRHDDHNLDQPIDVSKNPVFGFLYYPLAIEVNGICNLVLDRKSNTKINLQTQALTIDSVSSGPYLWSMPFAPLVEIGNSFHTPTYPDQFTFIDENIFSPIKTPPTDRSHTDFWRDFARFVWGQITLENY